VPVRNGYNRAVPTLNERLASLNRLADRFARNDASLQGNWLARFVVLRLLGLVYLMAFLTLVCQGPALLGPHGLLPIDTYLAEVAAEAGSRAAGFWQLPSLFWLSASDGALRAAGLVGVALSAAVLAGYANAILLAILCALQSSWRRGSFASFSARSSIRGRSRAGRRRAR
jgi:hypothetical protein